MNYLKRNAIPLVVGLVAVVGILTSTAAVIRNFRGEFQFRASHGFPQLRADGPTLGVEVGDRLSVTAVTPESPAQQAGIQVGDVIAAVNGHAVTSPDDLRAQLDAVAPSSDYTLRVTRAGANVDLRVHKGAGAPGGPPPGAPRGVPGAPGGPGAPGATPSPSPPATPETPRGGTQGPRLGITVAADAGGVRVDAVVPRSPADTAGVKVGDLITAANDKPTASVEDLQAIVADAGFGSSVKLAITRDGKPTTVTVRIGARPIPTRPSA